MSVSVLNVDRQVRPDDLILIVSDLGNFCILSKEGGVDEQRLFCWSGLIFNLADMNELKHPWTQSNVACLR